MIMKDILQEIEILKKKLEEEKTKKDNKAIAISIPLGTLIRPENVVIEVTETEVILTWDVVNGANSYRILASDYPESDFEEIASGVNTNNWSEAIPSDKRFYRVVASTDLPVRSLESRKPNSKKSARNLKVKN